MNPKNNLIKSKPVIPCSPMSSPNLSDSFIFLCYFIFSFFYLSTVELSDTFSIYKFNKLYEPVPWFIRD